MIWITLKFIVISFDISANHGSDSKLYTPNSRYFIGTLFHMNDNASISQSKNPQDK